MNTCFACAVATGSDRTSWVERRDGEAPPPSGVPARRDSLGVSPKIEFGDSPKGCKTSKFYEDDVDESYVLPLVELVDKHFSAEHR